MGKRNKDFEEVNTLTTYKLMLVGPICKKLKTDEIKLSKLNSQQIRTFVTREWEALKDRLKKKQNKIELSEEQERRIINWFTRELRKLKKTRKKQKEPSQRPALLFLVRLWYFGRYGARSFNTAIFTGTFGGDFLFYLLRSFYCSLYCCRRAGIEEKF